MNVNPKDFYIKEKAYYALKLTKIKQKLLQSSLIRLVIFGSTAYGIYTTINYTRIVFLIAIIGIPSFLYFVSKHTDLRLIKQKIEALIKINATEISVIEGDKSNLQTGSEFINQKHQFSYDIDLFGKNSFFQYLNRTATSAGKYLLAKLVTTNQTNAILEKQEAIKELANKPKWRQNFTATASLVQTETNTNFIVKSLKEHKASLPKFMQFVPMLFFAGSILLFSLNYFAVLPYKITAIWFGFGMGISKKFLKKVGDLYQKSNLAKDTFKQYYQLLLLIEKEKFTAKILQNQQQKINSQNKKASEIFKEFSKLLDALDQRNNIIFAILGNGFALRDIHFSYKIEQWIQKNQKYIENWFEVIAFFDAYNSFANYAFNHKEHVFPSIENANFTIKATNLGHPLLAKEKRIDNDFYIKDNEFFIITGANMAGKSTFLRTVSLSIILANNGLPVCAEKFEYKPIKLITSMRTSDSLSDDESYFFSELKRLKFIVDAVKTDTYFIILDEILKGTNSTDKAIGSRKFVERLVQSNATGIIATHDLSLCEIATELPQVKNYYFDAEIIKDELHFDYTFKKGVCQNMNASFLLKKMEIV